MTPFASRGGAAPAAGSAPAVDAPSAATRRRLLGAAIGGLATLGGCVTIGIGAESPAPAYLTLQDPAPPPARLPQPLVAGLLIQPEPADALADTASIAYQREPGVAHMYQLSSWSERPVRALPRLLQRRLDARGVAAAVGQPGDPVRAEWLLTLRVETILHDASVTPSVARLALTATLYDRRQRVRLAQRRFAVDEPAERVDAPAAAAAMSRAVARSFDALLPWAEDALRAAAALPRPARPGAATPSAGAEPVPGASPASAASAAAPSPLPAAPAPTATTPPAS
jgi:ABC-type uncharacterized transport system auxiliary subunit